MFGGYLIFQTASRRATSAGPVGLDPGARAFDGARAGLSATAGLAGRTSVSQLNEFALCGGGHRVVQSADFRGGSITVIAGGFDIDLRETAIAGDSVAIELFVMMGGVVLRIPESWKVVVNVTPLLGGSDLKARTIAPPEGAVRHARRQRVHPHGRPRSEKLNMRSRVQFFIPRSAATRDPLKNRRTSSIAEAGF